MVSTQGGSKSCDICEQQFCHFLPTTRPHFAHCSFCSALLRDITFYFQVLYNGQWPFSVKDIVLTTDNDTSWGPYSSAESTSVKINLITIQGLAPDALMSDFNIAVWCIAMH